MKRIYSILTQVTLLLTVLAVNGKEILPAEYLKYINLASIVLTVYLSNLTSTSNPDGTSARTAWQPKVKTYEDYKRERDEK